MLSNSFRAIIYAKDFTLLQHVIEFVQGLCAANFVKLNLKITKPVLGKRILCFVL
jgi:hypothetical protein